jgi:uncharacterized protein (TIGR02588 family)
MTEHAEQNTQEPRADVTAKDGKASASPGPRRFAEWLSFGISLALLLAVVSHLLWRLREPVTDTVLAQVSLQLDRVSEQQGRFVLPVLVRNPGARTLRDVQVRVEYREHGERRSVDVLIDYVGQSAEQVIFVYFSQHPRSLSVSASPLSYSLD